MTKPFKSPKEMSKKAARAPVSTRIKESSRDILEKAAKANKMTMSELLANILDDYAHWLHTEGK